MFGINWRHLLIFANKNATDIFVVIQLKQRLIMKWFCACRILLVPVDFWKRCRFSTWVHVRIGCEQTKNRSWSWVNVKRKYQFDQTFGATNATFVTHVIWQLGRRQNGEKFSFCKICAVNRKKKGKKSKKRWKKNKED